MTAHPGYYARNKSSVTEGYDSLRGVEAYGTRDAAHSSRAERLQRMANWRERLKASGVADAYLPIPPQDIGDKDFVALSRQYGRYDPLGEAGLHSDKPIARQASAATTPQVPVMSFNQPSAPAPAGRGPTVQTTSYSAGLKPGNPLGPVTAAPISAPAARPDPLAPPRFPMMTPTGLQAPALRPDGSQMSNPDGSARFVGTLANRVPASVESRVLDTGVGPTNYKGESNLQTTSGPQVLVDPRKDMTKNWLPAGDPLLPKNATAGVVVDQRYQTPGASPVGFATMGPAKVPQTPVISPITSAIADKAGYGAGVSAQPFSFAQAAPGFGVARGVQAGLSSALDGITARPNGTAAVSTPPTVAAPPSPVTAASTPATPAANPVSSTMGVHPPPQIPTAISDAIVNPALAFAGSPVSYSSFKNLMPKTAGEVSGGAGFYPSPATMPTPPKHSGYSGSGGPFDAVAPTAPVPNPAKAAEDEARRKAMLEARGQAAPGRMSYL